MARTGTIPLFLDPPLFWWVKFRYTIILPIAGYMLWFSALSSRYMDRPLIGLSFASVILSIAVFFLYFTSRTLITSGTEHNHWIKQATEIDNLKRSGIPKTLDVEIHPDKWHIHLQAPRKFTIGDQTAVGIDQSNSSMAIQVNSGSNLGKNADWWLVAKTPWGHWYSYAHPNQWVDIGTDLRLVTPAYQGPLVNISLALFNITTIPSGSHILYFGVDTNMNGVLDYDELYYSSYMLSAR